MIKDYFRGSNQGEQALLQKQNRMKKKENPKHHEVTCLNYGIEGHNKVSCINPCTACYNAPLELS